MFSSIFAITFPVFGIIAIGMIARHVKIWDKGAVIGLNNSAYYIGLPALIFLSIIALPINHIFNRDNLIMISGVIAVHVVVCVSVFAVTRLLKTTRKTSATAPMLSSFGSTAYLGIPFVTSLVGTEGAAYAAFISTVLIAVLIFLNKLILNRFDSLPSTKNTLIKLFELPFVWAMILG